MFLLRPAWLKVSEAKAGTLTQSSCEWDCKMEDGLAVSYKTKLLLPYQSCSLEYSQRSWKCVPLPKSAYGCLHSSFVYKCQNWKPPRCPSVGEWINKLWYITTMGYYSVLKRNELSSHNGEENGNPLQYSCLENSMGRGAWWATVHGVAKSWTRLNARYEVK